MERDERMKDDELVRRLIGAGDYESLSDALDLVKGIMHEDDIEVADREDNVVAIAENSAKIKKAVNYAIEIRKGVLALLKSDDADEDVERLYWDAILTAARYDFDSFCLYIEKDREPRKRFYQPRRRQLKILAGALQRLEDGELDLLAISLPPGVGKTTIAIFYICWVSGLHPELQNLIGSHNNEFLRGVYDECLRVFDPHGEYRWSDVFPAVRVCGTNAKDLRIDVGKAKRFQTVELTSLGSGNAGKVRATNLLYCDDLCSGIEEALSKDQMDKLWQKYTVDLRQRKLGDRVKELHIQTRWSLVDVVGRLSGIYENDDRALFINIPALDEDGHSNFEYPYGLGYSDKMIEDIKISMDDASFKALYMGEPIEREGQLYAPEELRRYFELPETAPDSILSVCDTKEQGEDYCVMPIVYQYGDDYYITDFICDNGKVEVLRDRIVGKIIEKDIQLLQIESNRGGSIFAQRIQEILKERGSHCRVTTKWTQSSKETRILVSSAWVKEHCLFKDESLYNKIDREYRTAMQFLTSYTLMGKNPHDDVPDVLSLLEDFVRGMFGNKITVSKRTLF